MAGDTKARRDRASLILPCGLRHFRRDRGEDKMAALGEPVRLERGEYDFCCRVPVSPFSADTRSSLIPAASPAAQAPGPDSNPRAAFAGLRQRRAKGTLPPWGACSAVHQMLHELFLCFFFSPLILSVLLCRLWACLFVFFFFFLISFEFQSVSMDALAPEFPASSFLSGGLLNSWL